MKKIISAILVCAMLAALFIPCALAEDAKEAAAEACPAWGDIDRDGKTTSGDARLVLRQSVGLEDYKEEDTNRCDLDRDNKISSSDARSVLRLSVNLDPYPAHETVPSIGKDATCTEDGLTDGVYCTICEQELVKQEVIPSPGHQKVVDEAVPATCTEQGKTEGEHCAVCKLVFVEQQDVPALGHDPVAAVATATDVCEPAKNCSRCGIELSPELKHDIKEGATVTAEKGITCQRCNKTTMPSFNDLVNPLKQKEHTFRSFSRTDTNISSPKFTGIMLAFRSDFEKEFTENMQNGSEYDSLTATETITPDNFEVVYSDAVSLLTDADLQSSKTEVIKGVDFLSTLPDSFTGQYGRVNDLKNIKAKQFGDVLKVSLTLKTEKYSETDKNNSAIPKIAKRYADMLNEAISEFSSLNADFMHSTCDSDSTANVVYYFDKETLAPIAAVYSIDMDMDQAMSIDLSNMDLSDIPPLIAGIISTFGKMGSISFDVKTDIYTYCFFDSYFD